MLRIAVAAAVVGFLVADGAGAQGAADSADLRRWDFTLQNVRYQILLPQRAATTKGIDRFSVSTPGRRVRQLHLLPAPRGTEGKFTRIEKLSNGAVLRYNVDRDVGGGSGGTEGLLEGVLEIGARTLAVTCHDQDEFSAPRPEWCLQFLRYLGIDKDR